MANPRRTYSGSWHRVADLKPRVRAGVRVTRQRFRGRLWYLFHDPSSTSHYRMSRPAYALAGLLDGRRTVDEAWRIASEQLGDEAPTQDEAITVLGQMHSGNLLHADMAGDAELLLRRRTRTRQRETRGYLYNILFARFRVADPDALMGTLRPVLGPLFSSPGLVAWMALVVTGAILAVVHWGRMTPELVMLIRPSNLVLLYCATVLGKLLHELAHGVACKQMARSEGQTEGSSGVHAIGVMLLVLVPFPYIDASSAWTLRSRYRRAIVGAAGIMSDLALAGAAMIVWARTSPETLTHRFALNLAFVSSVSSILFNANPLMRFDGYYIMTDLIGQPNLYQRSRETLLRLLRRVLFGVRDDRHYTVSRGETVWHVLYALSASVYRVFIFVAIIVLIATQWFALALPLAGVAVVAFLLLPIGKLIAYLAHHQQLDRHRRRAVIVTGAIAGFALMFISLVPIPDRVRATGIVEPMDQTEIYARASGVIESIAEPSSAVLGAHQTVVSLNNRELESRVAAMRARLEAATLSRRRATGRDPAVELALVEQVSALRAQLDDLLAQHAALEVRVDRSGVWIPASHSLRPGVYVRRADPLGRVIDETRLRVRVAVSRFDAGVVESSAARVEVRARGLAGEVTFGRRGGLQLAADGSAEPFELFVPLDADAGLRAGRAVRVRFSAPAKPILHQLSRAVRQTLQRGSPARVPAPRGAEQ